MCIATQAYTVWQFYLAMYTPSMVTRHIRLNHNSISWRCDNHTTSYFKQKNVRCSHLYRIDIWKDFFLQKNCIYNLLESTIATILINGQTCFYRSKTEMYFDLKSSFRDSLNEKRLDLWINLFTKAHTVLIFIRCNQLYKQECF